MTAEKNKLPNEYEVVRISGLEPPVTAPISATKPKAPETKIGKGPKKTVKTKGKRAKVTFRFSSSTAGATFECALVTIKKGKGKKTRKPKFKGCKSPKKLSLKPGKYRFSVRAVARRRRRPITGDESLQGRSRQELRPRSVIWTIGIVRPVLAASRR